jgi:hypothetical protein
MKILSNKKYKELTERYDFLYKTLIAGRNMKEIHKYTFRELKYLADGIMEELRIINKEMKERNIVMENIKSRNLWTYTNSNKH